MAADGRSSSARRRRLIQIGATAVGLGPLVLLGFGALTDRLGANPIEEVTHTTGETGLRLLILCLAVTPVRRLCGWSWAAPLRRTFGLLAFLYVTLHLLTYVALEQFFDWPLLLEDVLERPYITVGFAGFLCLVPLAVTSTRGMMRRLGRRWVALHRLTYLAAVLGVVHHLWLVKADLAPPLVHAAAVALLLLYRVRSHFARTTAAPAT